ncbi:hypothetical protein LCGC14_1972850 [marine sediment metagenome]|uniref:Carbohydrate-binding module family 96 domain-containing protein n=1 Tax=marine sediment metagenome TaxID=412755 RepID=A0A0F9I8C7_9ZZZZ
MAKEQTPDEKAKLRVDEMVDRRKASKQWLEDNFWGEWREAYQQYISAYNKLTKLMAAGKGDTPEGQEAYKKMKHYKDLYEASLGTGVGKTTNKPAGNEHPKTPDKDITTGPHLPVVTSKPGKQHIIRLGPVADSLVYAYAYRNWNKSNRGAYNILQAGWHPAGGESRAYLKFDLSGVNPNSIGKATLRLFHYHTGGNNSLPVGVHAVTGTWQEGSDTYHSGQTEKPAAPGEISWINQPSFDPRPVAQFNPGPGTNKWIEVDITPLVKAWLSGTPNKGLMLKPEGNLTGRSPESAYGFYSREHEDKTKRPVLIFQSAGGTDTPNDPGDEPDEGPGKKIVLDFEQLTGRWVINQSNAYRGTLNLQQDLAGRLTGTANWSGDLNGTIAGKISGNVVEFTISYSRRMKGLYKGTLTRDGTRIVNGNTKSSTGESASWDATR